MAEENGTNVSYFLSLNSGDGNKALSVTTSQENSSSQKTTKTEKKQTKQPAPAVPAVSPEVAAKRFTVLRSIAEECITDDDLKKLLSKKANFRLYDGFEPSGRMHIAQGVFKAINVNKCTSNGGTFVFWVADWFALMNDKMGGDLEKIKTVGQYLIEVWKAAGMDMDNVEFRWASDDIINDAQKYWAQVIDIAKRFTVARIMKCCQIMGRLENNLTAAQILYPMMQCADVFYLGANICQLGLDQRKVNMLAREYCDSKGIKLKPVILSHHMLYGLKQGQEKMSKSDPDSAVFMEDSEEDIRRKIMGAYCPSKAEASTEKVDKGEYVMHLVEDELKNPCLDYIQYICMSEEGSVFAANGKEYDDFNILRKDFIAGKISELDIKEGLIHSLNERIAPVRKHFAENQEAKRVFELVQQYKRDGKKPGLKSFRRHDHFKGVENEIAVAFAPILSSTNISIASLFNLVLEIQAMPESNKKALVIPDLSAIALNSYSQHKKTDPAKIVRAAYDLLLSGLKALIPETMENVSICFQSKTMLENPSDYWISVINVGRHFPLQTVLDANGNSPQAGAVFAALLHVSDVITMRASRLICTSRAQGLLHELALSYFTESGQTELSAPTVIQIPSVSTKLREGDMKNVNFTGGDLFLSDSKAEVKKKIKQSFCAEGNVDFCPPLELAKFAAIELTGSITIGEKKYDQTETLVADFAQKKLHPSELKPAVTEAMLAVYSSLEAQFNAEPAKSAKVTLAGYAKKINKKN
mmetsp:Transcript_1464/g.1749  ORF Transcript_1464/g.1749 Transcript_1464/m.1749 type:complete len:755 (+) Transcript_1464:133-2397(+)